MPNLAVANLCDQVTICICTFRRPSVAFTIELAFKQSRLDTRKIQIVVVDNDFQPTAKELVSATASRLGAEVAYIHAPAENISLARNAALDAVRTKWAAWLDDDEYAAHDWLIRLMADRNGHVAVIGQSIALYQDGTPRWAKACDFHSNRITGRLENAYTSNALIDVDFVRCHGIRFPLECGKIVGEDTIFFRKMKERGGSLVYCPASIAYEEVYCDRADMAWVYQRKFRSGRTHTTMLARFAPREHSQLLYTATAKALFSAAIAALLMPFHWSWRKWAARAALHFGALAERVQRDAA